MTSGTSERNTLLHLVGDIALQVEVHYADLGDAPYAYHHDSLTIWLHEDMPEELRLKYLTHATSALIEESNCKLREDTRQRRRRHLRPVPSHEPRGDQDDGAESETA